MRPIQTGKPRAESISATEFNSLAEGLRTKFLAELLGVSKQMVCRYRNQGAPRGRAEVLRAYLRGKNDGLGQPTA